jgi:hypothetical protein
VEGRLARAQGDLTLSRQRLLTVRETGAIESWAAALDLALTAVLQAAPDAAGLLAKAQARRPPTLPAGHPLDAVSAWLQARQAAGNDDAPDVRPGPSSQPPGHRAPRRPPGPASAACYFDPSARLSAQMFSAQSRATSASAALARGDTPPAPATAFIVRSVASYW